MIGSDKKHLLTPNPRERTIVDSAGIIPFPIGASQSPTPDNCALFLETPIFRHNPCKVNMKTGKWANHVGKSLAKVAKAMRESKIFMCDAIMPIEYPSEEEVTSAIKVTPLSQILDKVAGYEKLIVDKINGDKDHIKTHNSIIRAEIVSILRNFHKPDNEELKNRLRELIKMATDNRRMGMTSLPLKHYGGLQNECFNGLDKFDRFYTRYFASGNTNDEELKAVYSEQEGLNVDSFVAVSRALHCYYNVCLYANHLKPGGHEAATVAAGAAAAEDAAEAAKEAGADAASTRSMTSSQMRTDSSWMKIIRPLVPKVRGIDSTQHQNDSKEILSKIIWLILIERFETLSSVVHTFFTTYAGVGSDVLADCTKSLTHMIILSSFSPFFKARAVDYVKEELMAQDFDETDRKAILCKEISCFDAAFAKQFPSYLSGIDLPEYDRLLRTSEHWIQLGKKLTTSLVDNSIWPPRLHDHLVIRDISTPMQAKDKVKKKLTEAFLTTRD